MCEDYFYKQKSVGDQSSHEFWAYPRHFLVWKKTMFENGWIKLHRKLKDKGYYKNPKYLLLWIHLLLSANHTQRELMWNNQTILIKEGQMVTGRKELSEQTGLSETTIERILNYLENEHQIGQQKTTKYRLITILNWKEYQSMDSKTDNKRTTNGHKQELKNDKNNTSAKAEEIKVVKEEGEPKLSLRGKPKVTPEMRAVFEVFDDRRPQWIVWGAREIQRLAAKTLFEEYGVDELKERYKVVKDHRLDEYGPKISTPLTFLEKMGDMEDYLVKQKR